MKHFVEDDGLNAFRLPVAWQYLVNDKVGGDLDETAMTKYDAQTKISQAYGASWRRSMRVTQRLSWA